MGGPGRPLGASVVRRDPPGGLEGQLHLLKPPPGEDGLHPLQPLRHGPLTAGPGMRTASLVSTALPEEEGSLGSFTREETQVYLLAGTNFRKTLMPTGWLAS
ncbi:hypothetical protein NHX12_006223 [Muraenolepis orangiensis]|uniref:Uncharacterized protein n=1 Tax=Muraenolepis orangiensis TaxID=630683 RepID=A0A9Q0ICW1_9TELE|nr:hypothetical protein NHX12_005227 [Muraenolepis orangiensis]KAJ3593890.1 hypothetical protein NHX12_006223 [Muraenolepis orangiensis]